MRQFDPLPLTGNITAEQQRTRLLIFLAWLFLIAWFWSTHVFWRDEVRAFTLALSGSNVVEMVRIIHGEGHPALWYLILRAPSNISLSRNPADNRGSNWRRCDGVIHFPVALSARDCSSGIIQFLWRI